MNKKDDIKEPFLKTPPSMRGKSQIISILRK